ncbi:hypothetical protein H6G00_29470 [Leptolyngbya sp. FACHB-541]|uniref:hypothetical protein n=1 Tax=Leptolyngbya sp. FACHB-541 TaxID=2692810 RepID=UPI001685E22F|nr:hypothetical protein [Leptolyngbya sp. FACHB-541]MBD2000690.1 hypothetical protein [Leptolyngbya sp. FACHB-541]
MDIRNASSTEIRHRGLEALALALGPVGMVRFLQQFDTGRRDYTRDRQQQLSELSLQDAITQIKAQRQQNG